MRRYYGIHRDLPSSTEYLGYLRRAAKNRLQFHSDSAWVDPRLQAQKEVHPRRKSCPGCRVLGVAAPGKVVLGCLRACTVVPWSSVLRRRERAQRGGTCRGPVCGGGGHHVVEPLVARAVIDHGAIAGRGKGWGSCFMLPDHPRKLQRKLFHPGRKTLTMLV